MTQGPHLCELASLAEHRLGDRTDPRVLDEATRLRWAREVTREALPTLAGRTSYEFAFWLMEEGRRVGTLAVSHGLLGMRDARVSSLYVLPDRRGGGVGRRALARLRALLGEQRCGYRLETSWCWPRVVRFYLRAGLWVRMWKHDLQFCDSASLPRAAITETRASPAVVTHGECRCGSSGSRPRRVGRRASTN